MDSAIRDHFRQLLIHQIAPTFRGGVPLAEQRRFLDNMGNTMGDNPALPPGLVVRVGEIAGRPCEWLQNPGHSDPHIFLYLHGGGYVMGSCAAYRALASRIGLACGIQAVVPEYRLAPEHPFPAGLDDAVAPLPAAAVLLSPARGPALARPDRRIRARPARPRPAPRDLIDLPQHAGIDDTLPAC